MTGMSVVHKELEAIVSNNVANFIMDLLGFLVQQPDAVLHNLVRLFFLPWAAVEQVPQRSTKLKANNQLPDHLTSQLRSVSQSAL